MPNTPAILLISLLLSCAGGAEAAPTAYSQLSAAAATAAVPAPPQAPAPQEPKEWTVLVYMNARNNLEQAGLENLNQLERIGSGPRLNIVAELGRMNGQQGDTHADGDWTGSRRYFVTRDRNPLRVTSPQLAAFDSPDMGDWRHLAEFARWGMANYPARHYALIIWNHGSGWIGGKDRPSAKGISYDSATGNHITTPELGAALRGIGKVDVLAYDACLMQMAELLAETRGLADFVVGSEDIVPEYGMPYYRALPAFAEGKSPREAAAGMARAYGRFYGLNKREVTISALDMSAYGRFETALDGWAATVLTYGDRPRLKRALAAARSYAYRDNKDLYELARLSAELTDAGLAGAAAELMSSIDELVIENVAYREDRLKGFIRDTASHGLAIYLPDGAPRPDYRDLALSLRTQWDEAVEALGAAR